MRNAAIMAGVVSGITAVVSISSLLMGRSVIGVGAASLFDAALFAIISWRVLRLSLPWAIAGLVLYVVERIVSIANSGLRGTGGILSVLFILYFIHGVRAGFFLRKLRKQTPLHLGPNTEDAVLNPPSAS